MERESESNYSFLFYICIALSCASLLVAFAGVVLPMASDVAVDIGISDLNDVSVPTLLANQTLVYNGTYWVNSNIVNGTNGTNGVDGKDGTNATVAFGWDDLNFPALSLAKSANLYPTQGAILASGAIEGYLFNGLNQVNEVYGSGEILHSYKQGSDLYPHVHWMATTIGAGNVTWFLEYAIADVNGVYGVPATISISHATTGAAWVHMMSTFPSISGSGLTIGAQITFRLYRNATAPSDTYGDNAVLLSFGIHYQMDSIGSSSIASK